VRPGRKPAARAAAAPEGPAVQPHAETRVVAVFELIAEGHGAGPDDGRFHPGLLAGPNCAALGGVLIRNRTARQSHHIVILAMSRPPGQRESPK
jgi:hypothetical protein